MGYDTHYKLTTSDLDDDEHLDGVAAVADYKYLWSDGCSWYDHELDMEAYSQKFPHVVFTLDGEGEESGDVWRKWFKNGVMQQWRLEIVWPSAPPEPWA